MKHITECLFEPLIVVYGEPKTNDVDAFLDAYGRLLSGYSTEELSAAADIILKTNKFKTWPTVAECVAACETARTNLSPQQQPAMRREPKGWSHAEISRGNRMIACDLGKTALSGGWHLGLWDHYRKTGREPTQSEISKIKASARNIDRMYAEACEDGHEQTIKLWQGNQKKRDEIAALITVREGAA